MSQQPSLSVPSLRLHKPSGRAVVTLCGRDFYCGAWGSPEAKLRYEQLVAEFLRQGRTVAPSPDGEGLSVNEVMLGYIRYADGYYRDFDGNPTREVETMKLAFRPLKALYGETPAREFGPKALKAVRQRMIEEDLCRRVINQRIGYIKRMFKWACSEELIAPEIFHRLLCVTGLQRGREGARESEPVQPVPDEYVDAILPFLPPTLCAMLKLQRLTGMRSGELCALRACDIDMSGKVWIFRPPKHKTTHLGHVRPIALGQQCQTIIEPFLKADLRAFLFSPRQAVEERRTIMRAARMTKVQPRSCARPRRFLTLCHGEGRVQAGPDARFSGGFRRNLV